RLGVLVVVGDGRRGRVVGAPPEHELLVAELLAGLGLVLALERAVVALVEPPGALDRQPEQAGLAQREVGGLDGPGQQTGVDDVGVQARLDEELPAPPGLFLALGREADVNPAGEQALRVPVAFAMPQQHQCRHTPNPRVSRHGPARGPRTGRTPGGWPGTRRASCATPTRAGWRRRSRSPAPGRSCRRST